MKEGKKKRKKVVSPSSKLKILEKKGLARSEGNSWKGKTKREVRGKGREHKLKIPNQAE